MIQSVPEMCSSQAEVKFAQDIDVIHMKVVAFSLFCDC